MTTQQLLSHLMRGGSYGYFWTKPDRRTYWWDISEGIPALPNDINGQDVYFGVHPSKIQKSAYERAKEIDIQVVNALYADMDDKSVGSHEELIQHINNINPPPSAIIDTGGGYHCYWLLQDSITPQYAKELQRRWQVYVGGDPGAKDLVRVLRMPGTINHKYDAPQDVKIVQVDTSVVYTHKKLETLLPKSSVNNEDSDSIHEGERNVSLTSVAGRLRAKGWDVTKILTELIRINKERVRPQLPMTELKGIAKSVCKYAPNQAQYFYGSTFKHTWLGDAMKRRRPFYNMTHHYGAGHLYSYSDGTFKRDGTEVVEQMAAAMLQDSYLDDRRKKAEEWIRATTYVKPHLHANDHPGLINVANGMLNWRTGELLPHDPKYLSTIQIPVEYIPSAKCPSIDSFLMDVIPADCVGLALEWLGYALLPITEYPKAVMCLGRSCNGKSTFLDMISTFLGEDNVTNVPLQQLDEHKYKRAMLQNKLANIFADLDQRSLKYSSYFKMIVAGDVIDAERKNQHPFNFRPFCKLIFSANKMPPSYDKSPAFYRRWIILPFPNTFEGANANPKMIDTITTPGELSGLLNRAVEGLRALTARGGFPTPDTIVEEMKRYKATSDGMAAFLSNQCRDARPGEWVGKQALYDAYGYWTEDSRVKYIESQIEFSRRLLDIYPRISGDARVRVEGRSIRVWKNGPVLGAPTQQKMDDI